MEVFRRPTLNYTCLFPHVLVPKSVSWMGARPQSLQPPPQVIPIWIIMSSWPTLLQKPQGCHHPFRDVQHHHVWGRAGRGSHRARRPSNKTRAGLTIVPAPFQTCGATQELKIVFHLFTSIYTSLIPQQTGRPLCCLWLVLKYLWTCNLNLPARTISFVCSWEANCCWWRDICCVEGSVSRLNDSSASRSKMVELLFLNYLESEQ